MIIFLNFYTIKNKGSTYISRRGQVKIKIFLKDFIYNYTYYVTRRYNLSHEITAIVVNNGKITIPKPIRLLFGIEDGDIVKLEFIEKCGVKKAEAKIEEDADKDKEAYKESEEEITV